MAWVTILKWRTISNRNEITPEKRVASGTKCHFMIALWTVVG